MVAISGLVGEAHKDACRDIKSHIRRGVDPLRQQRGTVTRHAYIRLDQCKQDINAQAKVYGKHTFSVALIFCHGSIVFGFTPARNG
jgi:hypothetical protein